MRKIAYVKIILLSLSIILASFLFILARSQSYALASECNDLEIIFARGSGQDYSGPDFSAFKASMHTHLSQTHLHYDISELVYPAVAIGLDNFANFSTALGSLVSAGESHEFGASVNTGIDNLRSRVSEIVAACPNTKFVLAGYSQGAMVVTKAIRILDSAQIIFAATFGDPKLFLPEGAGSPPAACRGTYFSDYRIYVPDCYAYEGLLGGYVPYQTVNYYDKLGTWCNYHDIMCSGYVDVVNPLAAHVSYVSDGIYTDASEYIFNKILAAFPQALEQSEQPSAQPSPDLTPPAISSHDVAIILDTSASMNYLFDTYRAEAISLAEQTLGTGGRIALIEYRDLNDPFAPTIHCDFSSCSSRSVEALASDLFAEGGGDTDESALSAIMLALNSLDWQRGAKKSIVLITDAGFHNPDWDDTTLTDVINRSLEIDPVNVYIMTNSNSSALASLATFTGGLVFHPAHFSDSTEYILSRPTVALPLPVYVALTGEEISFDATTSANAVSYAWDLDADGIFETNTTEPYVTKRYSEPFSDYIQLKVTDSAGRFSTASAYVRVLTEPEPRPEPASLLLADNSAVSPVIPLAPNTGQK